MRTSSEREAASIRTCVCVHVCVCLCPCVCECVPHLRWPIWVSAAGFFPGPQLCLRNGERERAEEWRSAGPTSVSLSFLSSSSSPVPVPLPAVRLPSVEFQAGQGAPDTPEPADVPPVWGEGGPGPRLLTSSMEEQDADAWLELSLSPQTGPSSWAHRAGRTPVNHGAWCWGQRESTLCYTFTVNFSRTAEPIFLMATNLCKSVIFKFR